jgi:hypothetical protein
MAIRSFACEETSGISGPQKPGTAWGLFLQPTRATELPAGRRTRAPQRHTPKHRARPSHRRCDTKKGRLLDPSRSDLHGATALAKLQKSPPAEGENTPYGGATTREAGLFGQGSDRG